MTSILRSFIALYTAMFLITMALGLLATFLSLRLTIEGYSPQVTGMILTSYYVGTVIGTFHCSHLIKSVGHIRSFAAFTAITGAMVMLHGYYISPLAWGVFRFITGVVSIGLFMVIESWLNECSETHTRGRVFSVYMVLFYLGSGLGQQFLNIGEVKDSSLFFIIGFLTLIGSVPIALTHSIHPQIQTVQPVKLNTIIKKAPMGMVGCLAAGLLTSSFYTMGPVFFHSISPDVSRLSLFMTVTVVGGLLLQWPLGAVSDRFDRSIVIPVVTLLFGILSAVMLPAGQFSIPVLMVGTALFGGLMSCIYPAAVARAHDLFESKDIVNVSSALLLFYGIGAILGPLVSSGFIAVFDNSHGFYLFFSSIGILAGVGLLFLRQTELTRVIPVEDQVDFMIMKRSSQVAMQMDPRSEVEAAPQNELQDEPGEPKDKARS
ncbi:MAG: MFS transporter [Desulfobacterales bacterium]|nr:MFS transporter [Desulfobacterales bacterium]